MLILEVILSCPMRHIPILDVKLFLYFCLFFVFPQSLLYHYEPFLFIVFNLINVHFLTYFSRLLQ